MPPAAPWIAAPSRGSVRTRSGSPGDSSDTARSSSVCAAVTSLAVVGTRARASQQLGRAASGVGLVREVELAPVEGGLLEVVAEDFLQLAQPVGGDALEPGGESLVELGTQFLRHRLVRRVADEDVREAVAVVAGKLRAVGPHEFLPHEREQVRT